VVTPLNALSMLVSSEQVSFQWSRKRCSADWWITQMIGIALKAIGPTTANARRPYVLSRCRGTVSWWHAADHRCWRVATCDTLWQRCRLQAQLQHIRDHVLLC